MGAPVTRLTRKTNTARVTNTKRARSSSPRARLTPIPYFTRRASRTAFFPSGPARRQPKKKNSARPHVLARTRHFPRFGSKTARVRRRRVNAASKETRGWKCARARKGHMGVRGKFAGTVRQAAVLTFGRGGRGGGEGWRAATREQLRVKRLRRAAETPARRGGRERLQ